MLKSCSELAAQLSASKQFKEWKKEHPQAYLSHFFTSVSSQFELLANWELGYYDFKQEKMTVFVLDSEQIVVKPADDVFKPKQEIVEELNLKQIKTNFSQVVESVQENIAEKFSSEHLGDGFLVVQTQDSKTAWNFSFVTKSLIFLNCKIDAATGEILSSEAVTIVHREDKPKIKVKNFKIKTVK